VTAAGVAPTTQRTLRRLFLTLFLRGRTSRGLQKDKAPGTIGSKLGLTLTIFTAFGLVALGFIKQDVFVMSLYLHAMTFVLLGMTVATSTGEVLFNKEEGDILMHRPIEPRALLWAKISVLVQVSLWLGGAFNLAGFFVGAVAQHGSWRYPFVHALSTSLEALFCTATVVLMYQLCLRWFGREKLDSFMTAMQIVVSIAVVVGGQIVPRVMIRADGMSLVSVTHWWNFLLPPAWFAGVDDALAGSAVAMSWWLGVTGLAATGGVLWLAFGRLAGDYQTGLQTIAESAPAKPSTSRARALERLVKVPPLSWWLRDPVSRASFLLATAYMLRDRDVKLRLYPGLAPMLVMPVIMLMPRGTDVSASGNAFGVAFSGAYLGLLPMLALGILEFSQQWAAADVFRLAPIRGPGSINHGARRAVLLVITLPMIILFSLIILALGKRGGDLTLLLPGLIALPLYALVPALGGGSTLLSRAAEEAKAAGRGVKTIGVMMSSAVLAGIAAFASSRGWLWIMIAVEGTLAAIAYLIMRAMIGRARWASAE
jgi:hypothetical protein